MSDLQTPGSQDPEPGGKPTLDYCPPVGSKGFEKQPRKVHPLVKLLALIIVAFLTYFILIQVVMYNDRPRPRSAVNVSKCALNLRQIGVAILLYCKDNKLQLPESIGNLCVEDVTTSVFVCPSTNDTPAMTGADDKATAKNIEAPGHCSYIYMGKGMLATGLKPDVIIAYEPLTNHNNRGMNVLFGDMHVEFLTLAQGQAMLKELQAGHNPPLPSTPAAKPK